MHTKKKRQMHNQNSQASHWMDVQFWPLDAKIYQNGKRFEYSDIDFTTN